MQEVKESQNIKSESLIQKNNSKENIKIYTQNMFDNIDTTLIIKIFIIIIFIVLFIIFLNIDIVDTKIMLFLKNMNSSNIGQDSELIKYNSGNQSNPNNQSNQGNSNNQSNQSNPNKHELIVYVLNGCPMCEKVLDLMKYFKLVNADFFDIKIINIYDVISTLSQEESLKYGEISLPKVYYVYNDSNDKKVYKLINHFKLLKNMENKKT